MKSNVLWHLEISVRNEFNFMANVLNHVDEIKFLQADKIDLRFVDC